MTRNEFHKALEKMRIKLDKHDIDLVFDKLDTNGDGEISYIKFCEFTEEKIKNLDPFQSSEQMRGLNQSTL